jgi:hypothetical protein
MLDGPPTGGRLGLSPSGFGRGSFRTRSGSLAPQRLRRCWRPGRRFCRVRVRGSSDAGDRVRTGPMIAPAPVAQDSLALGGFMVLRRARSSQERRPDASRYALDLTMALFGALGCAGQENGSKTDAGTGGDAGTPGSSDAMVSVGTASDGGTPGRSDATSTSSDASAPDASDAMSTSGSSDASAPDSSDAIAPVYCEPTAVEAGTALEGDANVPLQHRPTPACCPSQRGPGPSGQPYGPGVASYLADDAGGCTSDLQCTAGVNGRCFPFEGVVGPGGCSYDECFTDSNCGSKTPCLCRSSSTDAGSQPHGTSAGLFFAGSWDHPICSQKGPPAREG